MGAEAHRPPPPDEMHPDKPVPIGGPLPTYSDRDPRPAQGRGPCAGELGEIGIAGIGLAAGYLNRDEPDQKSSFADFLQIPNTRRAHLPQPATSAHHRPGRVEFHAHRHPGQDPRLPDRS